MRDIKLEVMFYVYNQSMEKVIKKHYTTVDRLCDSNKFFKQDLEILCKRQFTGLKDKNGVEVYEGDILKGRSKAFGATLGALELSIYEDFECHTHENHCGWNVCGIPVKDLVDDGLDVIGNIYENPELLESK